MSNRNYIFISQCQISKSYLLRKILKIYLFFKSRLQTGNLVNWQHLQHIFALQNLKILKDSIEALTTKLDSKCLAWPLYTSNYYSSTRINLNSAQNKYPKKNHKFAKQSISLCKPNKNRAISNMTLKKTNF